MNPTITITAKDIETVLRLAESEAPELKSERLLPLLDHDEVQAVFLASQGPLSDQRAKAHHVIAQQLFRRGFLPEHANWAYILQTAILFIGYALSPIFVGMMAFPSLQGTGRTYLLNLLGIMLWPFGWGVAGLITQGMIDFMTDQSFLTSGAGGGSVLYSLQNLMGLAFLGIWIIFSTIAAPVVIQKSIGRGISTASELFKGGFSAGRSAVMTGATTIASGGATGIKGAIAAGAMAAAAGAESLATASMNEGQAGGSLIGSLAQMNNRAHERERDTAEPKEKSFPPNDPSGDKTVAGMLDKSRNTNG